MDIKETAKLCHVIASLKPAQRFEEKTPTWWQPVLEDIGIGEALVAVKELAREEKFIDTSDICKRVAANRSARAQADVDALVPNVDPDDVTAFVAERRALLAAAAAGLLDAAEYARGGFTLTGAPPRRARQQELPDDPERVLTMIEAATSLPRRDRDEDRAKTDAERAAFERRRAEQLSGLQEVIARDVRP